eukprot:2157354-Rhodomonas_salina.5
MSASTSAAHWCPTGAGPNMDGWPRVLQGENIGGDQPAGSPGESSSQKEAEHTRPYVVVKQLSHGHKAMRTRHAETKLHPRWGAVMRFKVLTQDNAAPESTWHKLLGLAMKKEPEAHKRTGELLVRLAALPLALTLSPCSQTLLARRTPPPKRTQSILHNADRDDAEPREMVAGMPEHELHPALRDDAASGELGTVRRATGSASEGGSEDGENGARHAAGWDGGEGVENGEGSRHGEGSQDSEESPMGSPSRQAGSPMGSQL